MDSDADLIVMLRDQSVSEMLTDIPVIPDIYTEGALSPVTAGFLKIFCHNQKDSCLEYPFGEGDTQRLLEIQQNMAKTSNMLTMLLFF